MPDSKTLKECGIKDGVKVMMIGSKATDILAVASVTKDTIVKENKEPAPTKEPLCQQKVLSCDIIHTIHPFIHLAT